MTTLSDPQTISANFDRLLEVCNVPGHLAAEDRKSLTPASRFATVSTYRKRSVAGHKQVLAHETMEGALQYQSDVYDDIEADYIVDLVTGETFTVYVSLHVGDTVESLLDE
jgi:hypothetical protein